MQPEVFSSLLLNRIYCLFCWLVGWVVELFCGQHYQLPLVIAKKTNSRPTVGIPHLLFILFYELNGPINSANETDLLCLAFSIWFGIFVDSNNNDFGPHHQSILDLLFPFLSNAFGCIIYTRALLN